MLQYIFPDRGNDPRPPDLHQVVEILRTKYRVIFSFSEVLGGMPNGNKILGMFSVSPLTIRVCSSIQQWSPAFCKTLAHELGHLVLHRKMIGNGKQISREKPIIDTARQLRYRETAELSDLGWVEWQANEFAMCLILPRRYLQNLVVKVQNELGNRNVGTMYLDDQGCNIQNCIRIIGRIAELSGAKDTLLWRRLRYLGILEDRQKKRARPVYEMLDALFETDGQQSSAVYVAQSAPSGDP